MGIPVCTQLFSVPKKADITETDNGKVILDCVLDFENKVSLEERTCDTSDCIYVSDPDQPWPADVIIGGEEGRG